MCKVGDNIRKISLYTQEWKVKRVLVSYRRQEPMPGVESGVEAEGRVTYGHQERVLNSIFYPVEMRIY